MFLNFEINVLPKIIFLGQTICSSTWSLPARTINDFEMIVLYHGKIQFTVNESVFTLFPGDFLLIRPNEVHSAVTFADSPARFFYTHFIPNGHFKYVDEDYLCKNISDTSLFISSNYTDEFYSLPKTEFNEVYLPIHSSLNEFSTKIFTLFEKALLERNQLTINSEISIKLYISLIMSNITDHLIKRQKVKSYLSTEGYIPKIIQEALFFIQEHYNQKITLNDICANLRITPQYLIRLFKNNLATTPFNYINKFRISRSKDLLRQSSLTIKEITYAVGYDNPHYFSRIFKKIEGITPTEFKKGLDSKSNN